jgi:hypothetical protein
MGFIEVIRQAQTGLWTVFRRQTAIRISFLIVPEGTSLCELFTRLILVHVSLA